MALNKLEKGANKAPVQNKSPEEIRKWYMENQKAIENYAKAHDALKKITDVSKNGTKIVSAFNKEKLRNYLRNIGSNEKNLRNLSRYLFYRSQVYYRLIMYNATMFDLRARSVIPSVSMTEKNDKESILKSYEETLSTLDKLNLQYEFLKIYIRCFREDVFYGCAYYDDRSMFILPLDPDYCRIQGVYNTGDFGFLMDMSYFRNRQNLLEYWGEPFQSMWNDYQSTNEKFQPFPDEYAVCLKARAEDWDIAVPVFSGMLNSLINLLDFEDIQAISDEQEIYKMVWMELETFNNSDSPDDFKVDPDTAIDYFNRACEEAIPDYAAGVIVPGKLNTISFDNNKATDTNKIVQSTQAVLNSSGGSQILNSATLSTSAAFEAVVKSDTEFAISLLLPQTEAWVNRFLSYHVKNPAKVKFFECSVYTKASLRKEFMENAQNGLPVKLAVNALSGFSEADTIALNFLEEDCLKLSDKLIPFSSTYTQSSKKPGGQEKDPSELSDEGMKTRDKNKNG